MDTERDREEVSRELGSLAAWSSAMGSHGVCLRISEREERQWPESGATGAAGPKRRRRAARAQRRVRDSCVCAALWLRGVSGSMAAGVPVSPSESRSSSRTREEREVRRRVARASPVCATRRCESFFGGGILQPPQK